MYLERSGSAVPTTNNRMELQALIEALQAVSPESRITVYSDSRRAIHTILERAPIGEQAEWRLKDGERPPNLEQVQQALSLFRSRPRCRIKWVAAHRGNRWNERALHARVPRPQGRTPSRDPRRPQRRGPEGQGHSRGNGTPDNIAHTEFANDGRTPMLASEQAIVIAAAAEDWPDGRTLTPRKATREPNGTLWFGADLDPEGDQVWFRIEEEAIRGMPRRNARSPRPPSAGRPPRLARGGPLTQVRDQPLRGPGRRDRRHVDRTAPLVRRTSTSSVPRRERPIAPHQRP